MRRWAMAALSGLLLAASAARAEDKPAAAPGDADRHTVANAQILLHLLGIYNGTTNGTLGPQTKKALTQYQQKLKLPVTGMPDRQTLYALANPSIVATCADAGMTMAQCLDNVAQMRRFLAQGDAKNPPERSGSSR